MNHPPEACSYLVRYLNDSGVDEDTFPDEFELGAWFTAMESAGKINREDPALSVFCVTDAGRTPIDIMHPRLVRGRMEAGNRDQR